MFDASDVVVTPRRGLVSPSTTWAQVRRLAILGGHVLMGSDAPESMGFSLVQGDNCYINLEPDTWVETARLFSALSVGGKVEMPLQDMFWGGYFGSLTDQFGTRWMFNCVEKA